MTDELEVPEPYTFLTVEDELAWLASLTDETFPDALARQVSLIPAFQRIHARLTDMNRVAKDRFEELNVLRLESDTFGAETIKRMQEDRQKDAELKALRSRVAALEQLQVD